MNGTKAEQGAGAFDQEVHGITRTDRHITVPYRYTVPGTWYQGIVLQVPVYNTGMLRYTSTYVRYTVQAAVPVLPYTTEVRNRYTGIPVPRTTAVLVLKS